MITISLCMIVRNEAAVLARCLESVGSVADEIVIVDTGSTDQTREIARRYTDLVFDFPWIDDFSAARNESFAKASKDYLLWLDADDVILPADQAKLLLLKEQLSSDSNIDAIFLPYHVAFDENGTATFSYYRERLIRAQAGYRWQGPVHEAISVSGKKLFHDAAICHCKPPATTYSDRNLRIYEKLLHQGHALSPRDTFYYGRELYYHGRYVDAVSTLSALLDDPHGWPENLIEACRCLSLCYAELSNPRASLLSLLRALEFTSPRPELCCDLGRYFLAIRSYQQAIFWYSLALSCPSDPTTQMFCEPDASGYLPCIQLCLCYDALGDHITAKEYNERAASYKPSSPAVSYNRSYFRSLHI